MRKTNVHSNHEGRPNAPIMMADLPLSEKPYELMETFGPRKLTDAQLLSILLQSGTRGKSALSMAYDLLSYTGGSGSDPLRDLFRLSLETLREIPHVGRVRAIRLCAVSELIRRVQEESVPDRVTLEESGQIARMYRHILRHLPEEIVYLILVNTKNERIGDMELSRGTVDRAYIYPRQIFARVLEKNASGFVLLHNHPSGDPSPSAADKQMTERLHEAARLLEVRMLDHIIIAGTAYYSFQDHGLLL